MGRNKDIDFTKIGIPPERIHAYVNYRPYWDVKSLASAQHPSQGGGSSRNRLMPAWLQRRFFAHDTYIRAYPPVANGYREQDLFGA
jgi:mycothiol S-conjugate amidase